MAVLRVTPEGSSVLLPDVIGRYKTQLQNLTAENAQLRFNLDEAYGRIERLKEQLLVLERAAATAPE